MTLIPQSPKNPIYKPRAVWYYLLRDGDVAQLGERDNRTVEVRGSSPLVSTRWRRNALRPHILLCLIVLCLILCLANRKLLWYSKGTLSYKSVEQE